MSLFDDDFYSTRVSRRIRSTGRDASFSKRGIGIRWTPVRVAVASSMVSALAAVLVFGLFTGFDRSEGSVSAVAGVTNVGLSNDPLEKTISAAAKMRPAVVSIINEQAQPESDGNDSAGTDGGDGSPELQQAALGSGFIFEKVKGKAHIITNNHVIEDAVAVKAVLSNGETRNARVVGTDAITDLAVLEIDADGIDAVAEFGESEGLRAGQWVMAIGNPLGLSDSLTMGIVSKTKRIIPVSLSQDGNYDWEQEVIQIDASINQGNSGGPLIDLDGNVVGINSMKIAEYGVEGVGFAIPSHIAMPIVQSLLEYGKVKRPYLGVYTMDLGLYMAQQAAAAQGHGDDDGSAGGADQEQSTEEGSQSGDGAAVGGEDEGVMMPQGDLKLPDDVKQGVIVLQAVGPAEEAGLAFNDVIVKLDNVSISSTMELRKYLYGKKTIGDEIEVTFYRDGKKQTTTFKLAEKTEE
ncbi:S1C family serine protease [Paenibacillus lignilyticus]|uniref:Trypsin-like peptidase domain-containing protein n=1 Tax=Paenibacillus lignilyticus TaxID=1172615 RepID=A0ABS5CLW3_9BACL|nr:trypsin-like peptidase domain-containing protein [Paenibacillus lignilyticus]MBP3966858.1 trypsin-like peptidase domain-containing protein [Paenibacillus lignilyticus]